MRWGFDDEVETRESACVRVCVCVWESDGIKTQNSGGIGSPKM